MDRRQLIAGACATALASMPAVAAEVADPAGERIKMQFGQLLNLMRSEGFAMANLRAAGSCSGSTIERTSRAMSVMLLDDEPTPDFVAVVERAASIDPMLLPL